MSEEEMIIQGRAIAKGLAVGKPFVIETLDRHVQEKEIQDVDQEIDRYRSALKASYQDILKLKKELDKEGVEEGASILDAHLHIIEDPLLNDQVENAIREKKKNAEFLFFEVIDSFRKKFETIDNPLFQSRIEDLEDISCRVVAHLKQKKRRTISDAAEGVIVFSKMITPSEAAEAKQKNVKAFVTEIGGVTSHTAIVAKAVGIPYIAHINSQIFSAIDMGAKVVVDGFSGKVVLNPSEKTVEGFENRIIQQEEQIEVFRSWGKEKAHTVDGRHIRVSANVEVIEDFARLSHFGAEGVGLFRSEYIVLRCGYFPSEEEQYEVYKNLVESSQGHPVVIRAFDIGLDKVVQTLEKAKEENPALGLRAIRFLLKERSLFKVQIRAILRAAKYGDVRILLPMISCFSELVEAKTVIAEAKKELIQENQEINESVQIGCMIEVPSAAMIVDILAEQCDFISIGTNDLTQYVLAADRANQSMNSLYSSAHPGVLRLIQMIVEKAKAKNLPVGVCGEIASDPYFVPLLLGLGVEEFSVSCRFLPVIKQVIRHIKKSDAVLLVEKLMQCAFAEEVMEELLGQFETLMPLEIKEHF